MTLVAAACVALALTADWRILAAELAVGLAIVARARLWRPMLGYWRGVAGIVVLLPLVYSAVRPSASKWWIFGLDGFVFGGTIALRLLGFVTAFGLLLAGTPRRSLVQAAGRLNRDLGVLLAMTLAVIPVLRRQFDATLDAQRARGLRVSGSWVGRLRGSVSVLVPVVVTALVRARDMAMLLYVRGPRPDGGGPGARASGLGVRYQHADAPALAGVDLDSPPGRRAWVTGGSGSGKTTLLLTIAGVVPTVLPARIEGSIDADGDLGLCLADATVHLFGTAFDEVAWPLARAGLDEAEVASRVGAALARQGVAHLADRDLDTLSGGEARRVGLAAALVCAPRLVILDDPFAALDADGAASLRAMTADLAGGGASVLVAVRDGAVPPGDVRLHLVDGRPGTPAQRPVLPRSSPRQPGVTLLALRGVTHRFPAGGVHDVDLAVRAGEVVALVGPNGAGKSTLLKVVAGLLPAQAGGIEIGGADASGRQPFELAGDVGLVLQNPDDQLCRRTVADEVAWGLRLRGAAAPEADARAAAALDELGLAALAGTHPHDAPSSVRQLIAVAGALAGRPRLLLLDEPTSALDADGSARLVAAVSRRVADGCGVLVATHDQGLVDAVADRVVRLASGRVIG